jgi:hypothetical protein
MAVNMTITKSLTVKVAYGEMPGGDVWTLWWPRWKWERLTLEEKRQAIERQSLLMLENGWRNEQTERAGR